jgi:hypothetical protein
MKAIKFVLLGAGILGVIAFFLPYCKISDASFSAFAVVKGIQAEQDVKNEVHNAADDIQQNAEDATDRQAGAQLDNDVQKLIDRIKVALLIFFAPAFLFALIGGVGAARGKLERLGGVGALIFGFLGLAVNGLFLAAWSSADVKNAGGAPGVGQYFLLISCTVGFVTGLLTVIKPDRGGRFG